MKLYRIKDWEKHYEVSDSKKVAGPLQWVPVRTKTDGFGYARITLEKDKTDLLAAWYLMLGIAAKQPRAERGKLARDGVPLTPDDMEMLTRFPAKVFERALVFFADPKQGWLTSESIRNDSDTSGQSPAPSESSGSTGQDRTGHTIQDKTDGQAAAAAPASDSEWLADLSRNPAYEGINVHAEHAKMVVWCQTNRKQPSRRRFVNWLNRAEKPMGGLFAQQRSAQQPVREPQDWRSFLNHNFPASRFAAGQADEAHQWSDLDRGTQLWLIEQMRKSA